MKTIRVVLEARLLLATDRAARRAKLSRSALIREALRERLNRLEIRLLEERDRQGYAKTPPTPTDSSLWEAEARGAYDDRSKRPREAHRPSAGFET